MCVSFHLIIEDFRERLSNGRAVLDLFQKAQNELEHVMKGVCLCGLCACVGVCVSACVRTYVHVIVAGGCGREGWV